MFRDRTHGMERDWDKFVELIKLRVARGDGNAGEDLGKIYGDKIRYEDANSYYFEAIKNSADKYAALHLSEDYFYGHGLDKYIAGDISGCFSSTFRCGRGL